MVVANPYGNRYLNPRYAQKATPQKHAVEMSNESGMDNSSGGSLIALYTVPNI